VFIYQATLVIKSLTEGTHIRPRHSFGLCVETLDFHYRFHEWTLRKVRRKMRLKGNGVVDAVDMEVIKE
jgi:hypothetical protein